MAALSRQFRVVTRSLTRSKDASQQSALLARQLAALRLTPCTSSHLPAKFVNVCGLHTSSALSFHTTHPSLDLMEFFDRKDVWGEPAVTTGRPYRIDELRIKSSEDLHKLWYVLLKERNMLLTMEAEYNRNTELFPSPERITKVEESMENIMEVVKERDNAVSLLETGKPKDPGGAYVRDFLGRIRYRKFQEYAVPPHMNKVYSLLFPRRMHKVNAKYLPLWREKIARSRWDRYHQQLKKNQKLIEKFPHLEGKLEVPLPEEPEVS